MTEFLEHKPVLYREVVEFMNFADRKVRIIDGTLGNGGHTKLLLEANSGAEVLGIDRDTQALERAAINLKEFSDRVHFLHGTFSNMREFATELGWDEVDGILLDIGVSSPQLDDAKRGFSWRMDGPLDMRMDRKSPLTASRILNNYSKEELIDIFRKYGEIPQAAKLADFIIRRREIKPLQTTADFVAVCDEALGGKGRAKSLPAPTLPFQAIRIAVNDELGELERALQQSFGLLAKGGILEVISFHSLEDRIAKHFMKELSCGCICPPSFPVCVCNHKPELEILTKGVITAQKDELEENKRSSCAKLRIARKL